MYKAANLPPNTVKKEIHSSERKTLKMQVPERCAKLQYLNNCSPIHTYIIYNIIYSNKRHPLFSDPGLCVYPWGGWTCNSKCSKSIRLPRGTAAGEPRRPFLGLLSLDRKVNSESILTNIWPAGQWWQQTKQRNYKNQNCCAGMELRRRSTETSLDTRTAIQVPNTVLRMALWQLCPHREVAATSTGFHIYSCFSWKRIWA